MELPNATMDLVPAWTLQLWSLPLAARNLPLRVWSFAAWSLPLAALLLSSRASPALFEKKAGRVEGQRLCICFCHCICFCCICFCSCICLSPAANKQPAASSLKPSAFASSQQRAASSQQLACGNLLSICKTYKYLKTNQIFIRNGLVFKHSI